MTVRELQGLLNKYDADLPVVLGDEANLNEVTTLELRVKVKSTVHDDQTVVAIT